MWLPLAKLEEIQLPPNPLAGVRPWMVLLFCVLLGVLAYLLSKRHRPPRS